MDKVTTMPNKELEMPSLPHCETVYYRIKPNLEWYKSINIWIFLFYLRNPNIYIYIILSHLQVRIDLRRGEWIWNECIHQVEFWSEETQINIWVKEWDDRTLGLVYTYVRRFKSFFF